MWIFDLASGVIVAANDAAITAYGYTRNELLERSLGDLCANREETDELFASVASGSWDGKLELRRKDLTTFTANVAILRTGDPPNAGMVIATPVRESATLAPRGSC